MHLRRNLLALVTAAGLLAACADSGPGQPGGTAPAAPETTAGADPATTRPTAATSAPTTAPPGPVPDLALVPLAAVDQPTALAPRPGTDDLYVAERAGRVRRIQRTVDPAANSETVRLVPEPVLDVTALVDTTGERGLLGLAFSPDGDELYIDRVDRQGLITVAAYPMTGDGRADKANARVVLTIPHPRFSNHNGGDVVVGPDGMLYITVGDGGGGGDPDGNGQKLTTLLAKILRIDPRPGAEGRPYTVPADNPYASGNGASGGGARPEIWIWGVRNPWRISFDRATGDLWVADVGQNQVEEVDRLAAAPGGAGRGANLGWNLMEGDQRFSGDGPPAGHTGPVHTYRHGPTACSVTGGYVYRGAAIPSLAGTYLFADYCGSRVSGLRARGDTWTAATLPLTRTVTNVISFGQDNDGELYVLEQGGAVSRLNPAGGGRRVVTRSS